MVKLKEYDAFRFIESDEYDEDDIYELIDDENDEYKKLKTLNKIKEGQELTIKYSLYEICDYL